VIPGTEAGGFMKPSPLAGIAAVQRDRDAAMRRHAEALLESRKRREICGELEDGA
jgi:hypothetical protein